MHRIFAGLAALLIGLSASAEMTLNVMSFNLRFGTARDGEDSWDHRRDRLVDTIRRQNPDIIGTQECLDFQAEYIVQQLPDYRWFGIGRDKDGSGEMTAILYKKDALVPVATGNFWLSETPEVPGSMSWDTSLTRLVTWIRFYHPQSGVFFYHFNTHFDHRGGEARAQSAALIAKRIAELGDKSPVVLTGDFNSDGDTTAPWETLTASGLRDAWVSAGNKKGPRATWCAFKAPEPDGNRIDWIFASPQFQIEDMRARRR